MTEPSKFAGGYDHDEVRCEAMEDFDSEFLLVGSLRTCCVCIEHGCAEHLAEREKHPKQETKVKT